MAQDSAVNGRATLRDIMQLQHDTQNELKEIRKDVAAIRALSTKNTAIIAVLVSLLVSVVGTVTSALIIKGVF